MICSTSNADTFSPLRRISSYLRLAVRTQISPTDPGGTSMSCSSTIRTSTSGRTWPEDRHFPAG